MGLDSGGTGAAGPSRLLTSGTLGLEWGAVPTQEGELNHFPALSVDFYLL